MTIEKHTIDKFHNKWEECNWGVSWQSKAQNFIWEILWKIQKFIFNFDYRFFVSKVLKNLKNNEFVVNGMNFFYLYFRQNFEIISNEICTLHTVSFIHSTFDMDLISISNFSKLFQTTLAYCIIENQNHAFNFNYLFNFAVFIRNI